MARDMMKMKIGIRNVPISEEDRTPCATLLTGSSTFLYKKTLLVIAGILLPRL